MNSCGHADLFRDNMSALSKKEEEKNEKVIRALMKLPENRKCINCASVVSLLSQLLDSLPACVDEVSRPWRTDNMSACSIFGECILLLKSAAYMTSVVIRKL